MLRLYCDTQHVRTPTLLQSTFADVTSAPTATTNLQSSEADGVAVTYNDVVQAAPESAEEAAHTGNRAQEMQPGDKSEEADGDKNIKRDEGKTKDGSLWRILNT